MRSTSEVSEEYVHVEFNVQFKCSNEQKYTADFSSKLRNLFLVVLNSFKGIVHPEMKMMSSFILVAHYFL